MTKQVIGIQVRGRLDDDIFCALSKGFRKARFVNRLGWNFSRLFRVDAFFNVGVQLKKSFNEQRSSDEA